MEKGIEQIFVENIAQNGIEPSKLWEKMKKDSLGFVVAIAQDFATRDVLMLAYMDEEAFCKTIETGLMHYHSRSRGSLWLKGETSGHVQRIVEARIDCDLDALLFLIDQRGNACHTGAMSCFYRILEEIE